MIKIEEPCIKEVFIAEDGTRFDTEAACEIYELRSKLQPVWVIYKESVFGAQRNIRVYSSKEEAEKSLQEIPKYQRDNFKVELLYIDEFVRRETNE